MDNRASLTEGRPYYRVVASRGGCLLQIHGGTVYRVDYPIVLVHEAYRLKPC
jgi:Fe-S oxidoreductase